jgi:hypothetical protein
MNKIKHIQNINKIKEPLNVEQDRNFQNSKKKLQFEKST